jgi:hypothetical protein
MTKQQSNPQDLWYYEEDFDNMREDFYSLVYLFI